MQKNPHGSNLVSRSSFLLYMLHFCEPFQHPSRFHVLSETSFKKMSGISSLNTCKYLALLSIYTHTQGQAAEKAQNHSNFFPIIVWQPMHYLIINRSAFSGVLSMTKIMQ